MYIEYKILYIIIYIYIYIYICTVCLLTSHVPQNPRLGSQLGCATPEGISLIESGCLSADRKTWRIRIRWRFPQRNTCFCIIC